MDIQIAKNRTVLFIFLLLGGITMLFFRLFDFDGLYGQDAYAYKEHAQFIKAYLLGGSQPPKFFWPVNYPLLASIIDIIINGFTITFQLVSILSWSLIGYFSYTTLRQQFPKSSAKIVLYYVITFISFSPYLIRFAGCSMSDELTTLFVLICFKFALNIRKKNALLWTITFGLLAVFTRYGAIVLVVIPIMYSLYYQIKHQDLKFYISLLTLTIVIAFPYFYFNGLELGTTLRQSVTSDWSILNWFQNEFDSPEGIFIYDFPNLLYSFYPFFHPMFFFLGLPLLAYAIYTKVKLRKIMIASLVLYLLFIAGIHFQNKRFFVLCIPLVGLLLYPTFQSLISSFKNKSIKATILLGVLMANLALSAYTINIILSISNYEKKLLSQLSEINHQDVYTFEIDIIMKGRNIPNRYHNLWESKSISPNSGSIIIINSKKWETQWSNHHLMAHCRTVESSNSYVLIKELSDGWKMYKKL